MTFTYFKMPCHRQRHIVYCSNRKNPNSKGAKASRAMLEQAGVQSHKFSPSRPTIELTLAAPFAGLTAPGESL